MRVMRMCSGLGNTMFQYATYLQLKKLYPEEDIYVDTLWHRYTEELGKFELVSLFDLEAPDFFVHMDEEHRCLVEDKLEEFRYWKWNGYSTRDEMLKGNEQLEKISRTLTHEELPALYNEYANYQFKVLVDDKMNHISLKSIVKSDDIYNDNCKRNRIFASLKNNFPFLLYTLRIVINKNVRSKFLKDIMARRKPDFTGAESVERLKNDGDTYYNIYGNFNDCDGIREELLDAFRFREFAKNDRENIELKKRIEATNSVSIHVRVLDYEYGMGGILKNNYFKKAVKYIKKKSPNPSFFIFSDNINWCKENIDKLGLEERDDISFVSNNTGKNSYKDMQLMSYCKHNIVPNSTFSWWGAYLNDNKEKIVVTPYATLPGTISF